MKWDVREAQLSKRSKKRLHKSDKQTLAPFPFTYVSPLCNCPITPLTHLTLGSSKKWPTHFAFLLPLLFYPSVCFGSFECVTNCWMFCICTIPGKQNQNQVNVVIANIGKICFQYKWPCNFAIYTPSPKFSMAQCIYILFKFWTQPLLHINISI